MPEQSKADRMIFNDETQFNRESNTCMYSYAQNFPPLLYYSLDAVGTKSQKLFDRIKEHLRMDLLMMLEFASCTSLDQSDEAKVLFRELNEERDRKHTVVVVGFDDKLKIINSNSDKTITTGAN